MRSIKFGPWEVDVPDDAVERVGDRTEFTKTFDRPGGKRKVISTIRSVHFDGAVGLEDVDLVWVDLGDRFECNSATFKAQVMKATVSSRYKDGNGLVRAILSLIDGVPVPMISPAVFTNDRTITWTNVVADVDIVAELGPNRFRLFHRLKSATAPRRFEWRFEERSRREFRKPVQINRGLFQLDNENKLTTRTGEATIQRELEMIYARELNVENPDPDTKNYDYRARWTGGTFRMDTNNDRTLVTTGELYPVIFG